VLVWASELESAWGSVSVSVSESESELVSEWGVELESASE
jgi:hypothetical protein